MEGDWSTLFIAPAESVDWNIDMSRMRELLSQRYDDIGFDYSTVDWRKLGKGVSHYLNFAMPFMGEVRRGAYRDNGFLRLDAEPPERWADFIVWFLSVLPTDDPVRFNSMLATEMGIMEDNWIPHDASEAQVLDILKSHFASIVW